MTRMTAFGFHRNTHRRSGSALITMVTIATLVASGLVWSAGTGTASTASSDGAPALPAVRAAAAARAAAPAGRLVPQGCSTAAGAAACELYAMTGTASILGTAVPIWGFSTTGVADSASTPGPLLVVNQGDTVTITLHNQLPGESVSLAFPAQASVAGSNTPGDDLSGVATGSNRTYSFTANRPGTFLYQAGHTANGARQVAMGLAGALVVLPTTAPPAVPPTPPNWAYGNAGSAYHDEAVVVLSEIDPALNANPNSFDMRNFAPKYRMFNGKPYPAADPISTDQGHTVLMRYVNVGSQTHAISVLGGTQTEIALDAHPLTYPGIVTAESVPPGETLDTLVTMPTGPEARLAVYEPALHLDNNGQHTSDPLQFAFGGMLTFLDTAAPPPSADAVGPVSANVTLAPNPSDALADVIVTANLSDSTTGGSTVAQAEFVVDDPVTTGPGFGVPMTGPFGTIDVAGVHGTIPYTVSDCAPATGPIPVALKCLSAGQHTVFVRALDSAGNWGVVGSATLNLPKTGPRTTGGSVTPAPANGLVDIAISATGDDSAAGGVITGAEYFIDTAGANATGTTLIRNRTATVVSEDATIPAATVRALGEGQHHVLVHSKNSLNLWGPTLDIPLIVDLTGPAVDAASVGPNPTNGILTNKSNPGYLVVSAQITDKDAGGAAQSTLVNAEAFVDTATKPVGTGLQLLAVDGKLDATTEAVYGLIPISQIKPLSNGAHQVYVRGQDAAGNWGALFAINLTIDKIAPVIGAVVGAPNPTNGADNLTLTAPLTEANGLAGAEFWLGATDPGVGKGTRISAGVVGTDAVATVPLSGIADGTRRFNLRVQDAAGNWSNAVNTSVTVTKPNTIFASNFEPANPAWFATTGGAVFSPAAAMLTAAEPSNNTRGLQVTLSGGTSNAPGYVTDRSPAAETTYHARFAFNPNTMTAGTNPNTALTIFDGLTSNTTGSVFALQMGRAGTTNQLRTTMTRSAGGLLTGSWVPLSPGAHTVQIDWVAGPATGAAAGSLVLKIDGTTVSTQTGNTNALRLATVRLGVITGFTTGSAGSSAGRAYFDSFTSTRFTL